MKYLILLFLVSCTTVSRSYKKPNIKVRKLKCVKELLDFGVKADNSIQVCERIYSV